MNQKPARGANRKLLGVLGLVIGIGVVIAALSSNTGAGILSFVPYLLILACPLMMLVMMGSMGSMSHNHLTPNEQRDNIHDALPDLRGLSREEQVRGLRGELSRMAWRQEALRHDLDQLEAEQKAEPVADAEQHTGGVGNPGQNFTRVREG